MRLIFVGGCERSGTSLVQKVLVSHSRVAGGPEFVFTGRIAELYRRMSANHPGPYATRLEAFYDGDELAAAFRRFYAGFFRRLFERKTGAAYFCEKTPSNIYAAPQLLEIFPDSRFVHVVRDGRAVLASLRDVRKRFEAAGEAGYNRATFRSRHICARWNRAVDVHFELMADAELAGRVAGVKYEDLVREPERVLTGLFGFLDLDLEEKALAPESITAEEAGMPIDGFWYTDEMYNRGFDPGGIGRWKQSLPAPVRVLGSLLMAAGLRRLSYPVGGAYVHANRALRLWRPWRSGWRSS